MPEYLKIYQVIADSDNPINHSNNIKVTYRKFNSLEKFKISFSFKKVKDSDEYHNLDVSEKHSKYAC